MVTCCDAMAMKWSTFLLVAVAMLGCLSHAQWKQTQREPQVHREPRPFQVRDPSPGQQHEPRPGQQPTNPDYGAPRDPLEPITSPMIPNTCDVDGADKIQCGIASTSPSECEAIHCCFDGRMCYYGKAVTVQCTKDAHFVVVVARDATVPPLDLATTHFLGGAAPLGSPCAPVGSNAVFTVYHFPVTACGTIVTEEPGVVIYDNRLVSSYEVLDGPLGSITRDSRFELRFQGRYIGTSTEVVLIEIRVPPPPLPPHTYPGPMEVTIGLGKGVCFSKGCDETVEAFNSFYTVADYPVTKVLRAHVYVEVRISGKTDPNLVLSLGRCWTTSDPNPNSMPQWELLNGCEPCPLDRYQTAAIPVGPSSGLTYPSHYRRFVFQMFKFVEQQGSKAAKGAVEERVYVHCNTVVCHSSAGVCPPPCPAMGRKRREAAIFTKNSSVSHVVTSGELIFVDDQASVTSV